ncbi:MAG: hypothetical protein ACR2F9_09135 [Longimicrobiaceae bacterium]
MVTALFAWWACAQPAGEPLLLQGGAPSLDELGAAVVAALQAVDTARLAGYRVTEAEHNQRLWPHFPAAQQSPPIDVGFAWQNIELRNAAALERLLARYSGEDVRVLGTECGGEPEEYGAFRILRGCEIRVESDGRPGAIRPFASVVVANGRYKLIRYDA